ncbi:MAG: DUF4012 domain-containing protein [Patescibacteria group bacterium]
MKPRSKKNIHPVLSDVKHPMDVKAREFLKSEGAKSFAPEHGIVSKEFIIQESKLRLIKKSLLFLTIALFLIGVFSGWYLLDLKSKSLLAVSAIYDNLKFAGTQFSGFDSNVAGKSIQFNTEAIDMYGIVDIFSFVPILKQIPEIISKVANLTATLGDLNEVIRQLKSSGLGMVLGFDDGNTLELLRRLRGNIAIVNSVAGDLRNIVSGTGVLSAENSAQYVDFNLKAGKAIEGLDALISILDQPGDMHLLAFFENPSEIRPSGGFVGSYADMTVGNGRVKNISVDDIYRPDRFLDLNIVPPKQLQGITGTWRARDANWFFNFPDSAKKTIQFIEESSVYEDPGIKFQGVIAVNLKIIQDFLLVTGPIEMPEYGLILNDKNFLEQAQYQMEAGRDNIPGQNPKKIMKFILPKLIEKLSSLNKSEKRTLEEAIGYRLSNKDIKFYFKDQKLQNIVKLLSFSGEAYAIASNWNGDYLAVVNTNVAGGRTDIFMNQQVQLVSKIDERGFITDNLKIIRVHNGQNQKQSWYRVANINFLKVFTLPGSRLTALAGNTPKTVTPLVNYKSVKYLTDPDLAAVESTEQQLKEFNAYSYEENGKAVFGTWFNIAAGKSKELDETYQSTRRVNLIHGAKFQFVLDKQSGVDSSFDYIVETPPGYKWAESNDFIYHYKTDTIPSRLIIDLTLEKM